MEQSNHAGYMHESGGFAEPIDDIRTSDDCSVASSQSSGGAVELYLLMLTRVHHQI